MCSDVIVIFSIDALDFKQILMKMMNVKAP